MTSWRTALELGTGQMMHRIGTVMGEIDEDDVHGGVAATVGGEREEKFQMYCLERLFPYE